MKTQCVMCGDPVAEGILCARCDRPRRSPPTFAGTTAVPEIDVPTPMSAPTSQPPQRPAPVPPGRALSTLHEVFEAARVAAAVVGHDRTVRSATTEFRSLLGLRGSDDLDTIETTLGFRLPDLAKSYSATVLVPGGEAILTIVPVAGEAASAIALRSLERPTAKQGTDHPSMMAYLREAVLTPLRSLQEALLASSRSRKSDPLLEDAAATIDQILGSVELAPEVDDDAISRRPISTVIDILRERFTPAVAQKKIRIMFDVPAGEETFRDVRGLETALTLLLENSLHYVPVGGQIVVGQRFLDHKGKSLLLFFVMDNGPIVPESLRTEIFGPDFVWKPNEPVRTGRNLARCREFAMKHGGQIWVESKTGKTCTFFLRLERDS